jgi:hypothetical protein
MTKVAALALTLACLAVAACGSPPLTAGPVRVATRTDVEWRTSGVTGEGRRQHVVVAFERRHHELP